MSQKPLVSILMPVFNAATWLNGCLESIQSQSLTNWELLAVDDHSTDNSGPLLRQYADDDPRIKPLENSQKGIIPALRLAFQQSQGMYITRMDADDLMAPGKLEQLAQLLSEKGSGHVATGLVKYIAEGTLGDGYQRYESWLNSLCEDNSHYQDLYRECVIPSPCWMTNRSDLSRCGAFQSNQYPEDYDLVFRFFENGLKVVSVKEVLHYWRDHPARTSRTNEVYADNSYLTLKLAWFLRLHHTTERPLVIWGTGSKGKHMAKKLQQLKIPFHWVTNNPRKQGVNINGVKTTSHSAIHQWKDPNVIVLVAAPADQENIRQFWDAEKIKGNIWFFC